MANPKVLVARSKESGGLMEPDFSSYISAHEDSAAPDTPYVRNLVNENRIEILDELGEKSNWEDFMHIVDHETEGHFDYAVALERYRQQLSGRKPKEAKPKEQPLASPMGEPAADLEADARKNESKKD